jgi:hypothetical protein
MIYHVLGKPILIDSMHKPEGGSGSVFEFTGSDSLNEIGLNEKFWFKCNSYSYGGFSNELPISDNQTEIVDPNNDFQLVLAIFLKKCISNGRLTGQFEPPFI